MKKKTFSFSLTLNVPNILSLFRLSLIPFFILALTQGHLQTAFVIFVIAGITDALDGLTARWWDMKTPLGQFLDPMADKILMTASYIALSLHLPNLSYVLPLWLTIMVIFRDVSIALVALLIHIVTGMKEFQPSIWGKISTILQIVTIYALLMANLRGFFVSTLPYFYYTTLFFTIFSGFHYLFKVLHFWEEAER